MTRCEKCGLPALNKDLIMVPIIQKYEAWCRMCAPRGDIERNDRDMRAEQRYDGVGKDWR